MKAFILSMLFLSMGLCASFSFARVDSGGGAQELTLEEERQIVKESLREAFAGEIKQYPLLGAFLELKIDVIFDRVIKILKKRGIDIKVASVRSWIIQNKKSMMRQEGILAFMEQPSEQQKSFLDQKAEEKQRMEEQERSTASPGPAKAGEPCNPNIPTYSQKGCIPQE